MRLKTFLPLLLLAILLTSCQTDFRGDDIAAAGGKSLKITDRTDSQGTFKNADIKIWAEQSVYGQFPPSLLGQLLVRLGMLQFTIPAEYQCISDHYFRYSVFFKDL